MSDEAFLCYYLTVNFGNKINISRPFVDRGGCRCFIRGGVQGWKRGVWGVSSSDLSKFNMFQFFLRP